MPFVDPDTPKNATASGDALKNFIGRTNELNFFIQHILKPEKPTCNLLSISGDGGVGKSTLLSYFINVTRTSNFKDYCVTALVNERQTSPFSMMEKLAEKLHITGDFENAVIIDKEALRKLH